MGASSFMRVMQEKAKPNKYQAIGYKYMEQLVNDFGGLPIAWKQNSGSLSGKAFFQGKSPGILAPNPDTPARLQVLLHEIGHLMLRHHSKNLPTGLEEYEAEMFAFDAMQKEGVPISKAVYTEAQANVGSSLVCDEACGVRPDRSAVKFAADGYATVEDLKSPAARYSYEMILKKLGCTSCRNPGVGSRSRCLA